MTTSAGTNDANQGKDRTDHSHDHQNHADGANIEAALIRARSDSKIKDRPSSKGHHTLD